jgi:hypothetical protein
MPSIGERVTIPRRSASPSASIFEPVQMTVDEVLFVFPGALRKRPRVLVVAEDRGEGDLCRSCDPTLVQTGEQAFAFATGLGQRGRVEVLHPPAPGDHEARDEDVVADVQAGDRSTTRVEGSCPFALHFVLLVWSGSQ